MKLLFDGFWWHGGPPSGQMLLHEVVQAWRRSFPDDEMTLAVPAAHVPRVRDSIPAGIALIGTRAPLHPIINGFELPWRARRLGGFDAIVAQNFTPLSGPSAVMVQDAIFCTHPEWFTRAERLYLKPLPWMARRANVVATSTRAERSRIERNFPKLRGPVVTTGLGVPTSLVTEPAVAPIDVDLTSGQFLLSVGRLNIRKNLERTIIAAVDSGVISERFPLVIVGSESGCTANLPSVPPRTVRYVGYRRTEELRWLYENCALFLFLSLDEGFGLPPLESRSLGAQTIVSDIPPIRETLSGATGVTFVDPTDTAAITAAIRANVAAGRVDGRIEEPGRAWDSCVRAVRDSLADALERRTRVR